jgi:hypothetical protein
MTKARSSEIRRRKRKPALQEELEGADLTPSPGVPAAGLETSQAGQAARLSDSQIQATQRQALAAEIGRRQGNLHLRRVLGEGPIATVQRVDGEEEVEAEAEAEAEAEPEAEAGPSDEVPMISDATATAANEHIEERRWQDAIDVVVDDLVGAGHIDRSLLRRGRIRYSGAVSGEGVARPRGYYRDDEGNRRARRTDVRMGRAAFRRGLPWLVTSIMHEYQHVLQFQTGGPALIRGQAPSRGLIRTQEVEAYAWEMLNARRTGMAERPRQVRETWRRLHDYWSRLGTPGKRRVSDLYTRAHDEAEAILGEELTNFTPLEEAEEEAEEEEAEGG